MAEGWGSPCGPLDLQKSGYPQMSMFARVWVIQTNLTSIMVEATVLSIKENSSKDKTRKHKVKSKAKAVDEEFSVGYRGGNTLETAVAGRLPSQGAFWVRALPWLPGPEG